MALHSMDCTTRSSGLSLDTLSFSSCRTLPYYLLLSIKCLRLAGRG